MNFLSRLFGSQPEPRSTSRQRSASPNGVPEATEPVPGQLTSEQAVERYRYLLRTAPPDAIEQTHAEAFAQLTSDQRRAVLEGMGSELTPEERGARDDPQTLARIATRAELRRPGTMERAFGANAGGGAFAAGNMLNTIAAVVIGSAIADAIFNDNGYDQGFEDGAESTESDQGTDSADTGYDGGDAYGDSGGGFLDGGDF